MNEQKRVKFRLGSLFYNNKFVMVFSVFLSFILWITIAALGSEKQTKLISDIPVNIKLSETAEQEGLEIFDAENIKASVSVTGNRLVMGMISKDDIKIVAKQTNNIILPGNTYTLELSPQKNSILTDYEFSSVVSPNFITIYVDTKRETELKIEDEIKYSSDPAYFASATNFSSPTVKISGPSEKVSKIKKVIAKSQIDDILKETTTINAPLIIYDINGKVMSSEMLTMSDTSIEATIPILYKKTVSVLPDFTDKPSGLNINNGFYTINPSTVEIAGPENTVKSLNDVKLSPLDFSRINLKSATFDLPINLPQGCKTLNNSTTASIKINMSGMKERYILINHFNFINMPPNKSASSNSNINVGVIGPYSQISNLDSEDLIAEIDLKDQASFTGNKEMPVKIKTKETSSCWVFGEYTVNVSVNQK